MERRAKAATLAEAVFPGASLFRDLLLIAGFAGFTALCARIRVYLPFTPVPVTAQTLAVLLSGAVLGKWRGAASQIAYVAGGASGLPIFAGGLGGFAVLSGPTGGYLGGFILAAFVVGWLAEFGWDRRYAAAAMLVGNAVIYLPGLLWLAYWLGDVGKFTSWKGVLVAGLYPFVPGDLTKLVIAAIFLPSAWALVNRWKI